MALERIEKGADMMHKQKFQSKLNRTASSESIVVKREDFAQTFYNKGLFRTVIKHWKLYCFGRTNKDRERVLKHKVDIVIKQELAKKQTQIDFMENLIKEYEEQFKIELNKKALMRNDQDVLLGKTST